jgi:putative Holliday junction resolvase
MTLKPGQWLGFDFGLAWIGVAAGQTFTGTATGIDAVRARDGIPDWQRIDALIAEWRPVGLVVGIPYNMNGSDSEMGTRAHKFRKRLHGRYGLPAEAVDERLSSREARSHLGLQGASLSKARQASIDSMAAQLILETYLNQQA